MNHVLNNTHERMMELVRENNIEEMARIISEMERRLNILETKLHMEEWNQEEKIQLEN
jgi:hypothetical protein